MGSWREELESQITRALDSGVWDFGKYPESGAVGTRQFTVHVEQADIRVIDQLRSGAGCVNKGEFCGAKPGTLWISGAGYKTSDGITGDADLAFTLRENNWNYNPNPEGGWDHVVNADGESKYPDADFNLIQRES